MNERMLQELEGGPVAIGRYVLHRQIARGGMATIHIARLMGDEGFNRIVAAKRLNPELAEDAEFVAMFLDEARIASKVQHRNVVPVLDVVAAGEEVILVQEYVHGVPLHWLCRMLREARLQLPLELAVSIACQLLSGLHATHETTDELGTPLHIVHRDVSPHNVMLAVDGSARLLDFGVAKAAMAAHVTREGTYKGKLAYSAPEQLRGAATRQSDIYSLAVLLWELLVGQRMHGSARTGAELITAVLNGDLPTIREALSADRTWETIPAADREKLERLDPVVRKGLAVDARERWITAVEMEEALAEAVTPAPPAAVATWLKRMGRAFLEERQRVIAAEEASWRAAYPARSSSRPPHDSFINLRPFGRAMRSLPSDLIVSDIEARDHPHELEHAAGAGPRQPKRFGHDGEQVEDGFFMRLLAPASVVLAALALALALMVWRRGAPEATPAAAPAPTAAPATIAQPPTQTAARPPAARPPRAAAREHGAEATDQAAERTTEQPATTPALAAEPAAPLRISAAPAAPEPRAAQPPQLVEEARPKPARRVRPVEARRELEPEPAKLSAPAPQPAPKANDCAIPYYFEGSKKLFKPACL